MSESAAGRTAIQPWQKGLWVWVSGTLGLIGLLLCVFVGYTVTQMSSLIAAHGSDLSFVFAGMTLLILTLLRLLAILVGAGMVFGGLAVSFYTHEKATQLAADAASVAKGSFATSSPGIAAIVVGAVVILAALFSKGDYSYDPPIYQLRSASPAPHAPQPSASRPASQPASAISAAPRSPAQFKSSAEVFEELKGKP